MPIPKNWNSDKLQSNSMWLRFWKVTLVGSPHVWGHNCVAKAPLWEFLGISVFEMLWGAKIVLSSCSGFCRATHARQTNTESNIFCGWYLMLRFQHGLVRIRLREKIQTRQLMLSPGMDHWLSSGVGSSVWNKCIVPVPLFLSPIRWRTHRNAMLAVKDEDEGSTNMNLLICDNQ